MIGTIKRQAKDLMDELNRVDWPAKQQVLSSTWSTVAISIFVGFFLWACDWVLSKGVGFIIHTYSGYEAKVMESLRQRIKMEAREDHFGDIQIPEETYEEMKQDPKSGKRERILKKRKSFPGYLLVQIAVNTSSEMEDTDWHLVRNTPKVTSFVGANKKRPTPLTDEEVRQIMNHQEETQEKPKPKFHFEKGEKVRIIDGPFANFEGDVEEIHEERNTIRVMVTVFGRSTPVELDFIQVEKR